MSLKLKRKLEDENRQFQKEWEDLYFFIQVKDKAICLICRKCVSSIKSYNLKRHYEQKHDKINELSVGERKAKLQLLKAGLNAQQNVFQRPTGEATAVVNASMRISHIIAKKMKPFTDGEYIKECLLAAAEEIAPKKVKDFSQISLSRQTVSRRIHVISNEICETLETTSKTFIYFSLAFDETTDIVDTSQLAVFIRGIDSQMKVTEEFLDVVSLKNTTTGRDIKDAVIKCMEDHQLDLKNLIGIATDGAPSMIGKNVGAVTLILRHIEPLEGCSSSGKEMFLCHCLLHLENLCAQVLNMSHVMTVVVKAVNSIKNNSLKHRQFQEYLNELESEYSDVLFYAKIRWLSRGKCLERFWNLKQEIKNFMKEKVHDVPELDDDQWLLDLCFLTDITKKLNELNQKLQGEGKLITDCYEDIQAFVTKLKLYKSQLKSKNAFHFPLLNSFKSDSKDFCKYANEITKLLKAFQERFAYLQKFDNLFKIFMCPFDIPVEKAPEYLQLELIDLQSSTELKHLFQRSEKLKFYNEYIHEDKFPILKQMAMRIAAAIGTTY